MTGNDSTGKDSESMTRAPIAADPLNRDTAAFSDTDTHRAHATPWQQAPTGRRISFLAWGIAGLVGIALWVAIITLT